MVQTVPRGFLPREAGEGDHAKHGGGGPVPAEIRRAQGTLAPRLGPLHRLRRSPSPASRRFAGKDYYAASPANRFASAFNSHSRARMAADAQVGI